MKRVLRASAFSCVVMFCGDVIRQRIEGATFETWNRGASGRFAVVGATLHGPFFLYTFGLMDKLPLSSVKSNLGKALAKTLVTQFTIYPLFIVLFYGYIGLLEGVPLNQLIEAKKAPAMDTMLHGLVFWPIANTVNFGLVPSAYRVYYAAGMGVVWNTYISHLNSKKRD